MKRPNTHSKNQFGFTLIELQIALLLVAIISAVIAGAIRMSSQTWSRVNTLQDTIEQQASITRFVRRHLTSMRFLRVRNERNEIMTTFLGDDQQITFVAPYPGFKSNGELYWWSLQNSWDEEQKRQQLIMAYEPYLPGKPIEVDGADIYYEDSTPQQILIADNFLMEEVEYYKRDRQGVESWENEWETSTDNPLVVRFKLIQIDEQGEQRELPEIAITPRFASQQLYAEANP